MTGPVIDLTQPVTAAQERDRLNEFLATIEATRNAGADWDRQDHRAPKNWAVLDQLQKLERGLVALALDPKLADFLGALARQLDDIAEGR